MQQTQRCENCKRDISVTKAGTHFGYCKRNVIKCSQCGGMFDKNFLEEHQEEFHVSQECKYCLLKFKKNDVASHLLICVMRPKVCQYCQLDVPAKMFNNHLKICQSRTQICDLCQDSISNKDYEQHKRICRGKVSSKKEEKNRRNEGWDQFEFEDSLSQFERQLNKDKQIERKFTKEREKSRVAEVKEQSYIFGTKQEQASKGEKESSPLKRSKRSEIKKQVDWTEDLLQQHFFDNERFQDSSFNNVGDEYYQTSFNTSPYQQQLLFSSFNRKEVPPSSREFSNQLNEDDISIEDQFLQEALFDNSKRSRVSKQRDLPSSIPKDFMSEDILNSSFYGKDILDIEKQKAIEKQIQMSKKSSKISKKK